MKILKGTEYTYLKNNSKKYLKWGGLLLSLGIGLLIFGLNVTSDSSYFTLVGIVLVLLGLNTLRKSLNYYSGIQGEKAVTSTLSMLDDSNYLINDFLDNTGKGNVDHILLSPKGIFIIETKNYSGQIRCYGDSWSRKWRSRTYEISSVTNQAKLNAKRIQNIILKTTKLKLFVTPICVFTNANVDLRLKNPSSVILRLEKLIEYINEFSPSFLLPDSTLQIIGSSLLTKIDIDD